MARDDVICPECFEESPRGTKECPRCGADLVARPAGRERGRSQSALALGAGFAGTRVYGPVTYPRASRVVAVLLIAACLVVGFYLSAHAGSKANPGDAPVFDRGDGTCLLTQLPTHAMKGQTWTCERARWLLEARN